jgi:hypothetical protein
MAGEDKLTPTDLERLTYKQTGWNYILDRNMEIINYHLTAISNLLDVDTSNITNGAVLGWNAAAAKWKPMDATIPAAYIISGCDLIAADPAGMVVLIKTGTAWINYYELTVIPLTADNNAAVMDINNLLADSGDDVIGIDAASATKYRYDSIIMNVTNDIVVVKGDEFDGLGTIPDPPDITSNNQLKLGHILIPPGCTAITDAMINAIYE